MMAMQGGGGGREAMAMLAARLMGGGTTSNNNNSNTHANTHGFNTGPTSKPKPAPTSPSPTVSAASKATIPAVAPSSSTFKAPPPSSAPVPQAANRQPPHLRQTAPPAPLASSSASSSPAKSSAPAPVVNDGPSLRGSADQLAAAREFMSGATPGNPKSRGSSRGRVLSQEPSTASRPSASTASYAPAVASPRPRPSTTGLTGSTSAGAGGSSGGLSQWQALRGQPTNGAPSTTNSTAAKTATAAPVIKTEVSEQKSLPAFSFGPTTTSFSKPSSPVVKKEDESPARTAPPMSKNGNAASESPRVGKSAPRQFAEITNILNDRAADALPRAAKELPPHLRNKNVTSSSPESKSVAPQKSGNEAATNSTKVEAAATAEKKTFSYGPEDSNPVKAQNVVPEAFTNGTKQTATGPALAVKPPMQRKDSAAHISVDSKSTINGSADASQKKPLANGSADAAKTAGHYDDEVMQVLKAEVLAITQRLSDLEKENFALQKQVETLVQKEERRKFLGTESASAPFGVDVKGPNGHVIRVQATAALKVGEFIRRIRTKANLSPADSKDPRVTFDDKQLGHGVALGEVGVAANSVLLFTYSG